MTARSFILRGLKHYRSAYLGVLLGSALGAMVLLGALFAGDSVKHTLRTIAAQRTGQTEQVFVGGENFFRARLAADLAQDGAPILQLRGQVDTPDGRSTGNVDLLGVTPAFWSFAPGEMAPPELDPRDFAINRELARSLGLAAGDTLVIRLRKPGLLASDAPLSGAADELITIRGTIARIVGDAEMGRFSLAATQLPTPTLFLPLDRLAGAIEQPGRANLILLKGPADVAAAMQPADYGLSLEEIPLAGATEIRTDRIFIPPAIESKLRAEFPDAEPVLTYFVNTLAANGNETPYSMVTGVRPGSVPFVPDDLGPDEIILNSWEAEDLGAAPGDSVTLGYYVLGNNNALVEDSQTFSVRAIVPLEGLAADPLWMPDFPGIADAENSSDWTPGMPLDLDRIRDKDETYWDDHRGTPKAFISHATAARIWQNRWGLTTALRSSDIPAADQAAPLITAALTPADAGLALRDLAAESATAAASPVDIASLFLSMSFFLILAAVALTAMLFRFNVEQRNAETGLLAALGIPAKKILRWRLAEGAVVILLGSLIGCALAFAYTQGLLLFLERIWSTGPDRLFVFHAAPASIAIGIPGFFVLSMLSIWWVTRRQAKRSASLRLTAGSEEIPASGKSRFPKVFIAAFACGVTALVFAKQIGPQGAFFLAGFAFLVAGLALASAVLKSRSSKNDLNPAHLARLNLARRPTRSLVAIGSLAAGVFLVIAVTAFQKHGGADWENPASGAGGFALWIETTLPIPRPESGEPATFRSDALSNVVPFRLGTGDDASCFNLNSVARPRLIATDVSKLADRFTIKSTLDGIEPAWTALQTSADDALPAFVDETTLLWALKRKLGDRIEYLDESGTSFPVQIVGTLADSVFQGSLVVDESLFLQRFPSAAGHRLFLAETSGPPETARLILQQDLTDLGATITPTRQRLEAFSSVENTYIAIFNVLGGLGVILGSAGLGIVLARNLAERREELAMLHTIGIGRPVIRRVIRREARTLIGWALGLGLVAALVSIIPALPDTGLLPTLGAIAFFTILILLTATLSAWLAIRTSTT